MKNRPITQEEEDSIIDAYTNNNISIHKIVKIFRRDFLTIKKIFAKRGIISNYNKKFPPENIEKIIRLYLLEQKNCREIADIMGYKWDQIYTLLKKQKIKMRGRHSVRKYPIDNDYFDCIDSDEKAYFFGWLMAEGYMGKNGQDIAIQLQAGDIEILEKFKKSIKSGGTISIRKQSPKSFGGGKNLCCQFGFSNKKIGSDLKKHGMENKKSLTMKFPSISDEFLFPFLRGFMEGDGWISLGHHKHKYIRFQIGIMGTQEFLTVLIEKLNKFGYTFNIKPVQSSSDRPINMYSIITENKGEVISFLDRLYANCGEFKLSRKYEIYLKMKEYLLINPINPLNVRRVKSPDKMTFRWNIPCSFNI